MNKGKGFLAGTMKAGALISSASFAFCWNIPLILAGLGLGSAGLSRFIFTYRLYFLPLAFLFLGGSFYFTFKGESNCPIWRKWLLASVSTATVVILSYSLFTSS